MRCATGEASGDEVRGDSDCACSQVGRLKRSYEIVVSRSDCHVKVVAENDSPMYIIDGHCVRF